MGAQVTIRCGRIEGERFDGGVAFRGIPYATFVAGDGRFRAALPVQAWRGVRDARRPGPAAPQQAGLPRWLRRYGAVPAAGWSEDCLTLDIHTPACDDRGRPVLVFLHGGAFSHGSGSFWIYSGERFARRGDVVVVSIQYRLGAFGNLDLRWLGGEDVVANVGLRDQLAALAFVRDEIAAFGGDPTNVTVCGQSAGAMSLGALLGSRAATGLFRRAILQSGAARNVHDEAASRGVAARWLDELGVAPDGPATIRRLRALPAGELLRAQHVVSARHRLPLGMLAWQPALDGDLLTAPPLDAIARAEGPGVPLLIGTNRDEWKMFTATDARRRRLDASTLRRYLGRTLERDGLDGSTDVDEVLEVFGRDPETARPRRPGEIWEAFQGDRVFHRPAAELALAHAARGASVHFYRFDRAPALFAARVGACHAIELPFVFGTVRAPLLRAAFARPTDPVALADEMQDAWIGFARSGDPGGGDAGPWPAIGSMGDPVRVFGGAIRSTGLAPAALRRFWAKVSGPGPASNREARA